MLQLNFQFLDVDRVGNANRRVAIMNGELDLSGRKVLPDELEHEELVEIRVEQGADNGIEFPVMVMRAFGEVNDHARGEIS